LTHASRRASVEQSARAHVRTPSPNTHAKRTHVRVHEVRRVLVQQQRVAAQQDDVRPGRHEGDVEVGRVAVHAGRPELLAPRALDLQVGCAHSNHSQTALQLSTHPSPRALTHAHAHSGDALKGPHTRTPAHLTSPTHTGAVALHFFSICVHQAVRSVRLTRATCCTPALVVACTSSV